MEDIMKYYTYSRDFVNFGAIALEYNLMKPEIVFADLIADCLFISSMRKKEGIIDCIFMQ